MKKKMIALGMAALLLVNGMAYGELIATNPHTEDAQNELMESLSDDDLYPVLLPLIDKAAADAFSGDADLSGLYIGMRPMACDVTVDGQAVVVIGDIYAAPAQLDSLSPEAYGQAKWLDAFAAATLRRDASAASGWALESFDVDAEVNMTDIAESYFDETLKAYTDTAACYSVQYPAVFPEPTASVDADGCSGVSTTLKDQTASFSVGCRGNEKNITMENIVSKRMNEHPDMAVAVNHLTGVTRLTWKNGKTTTAECWIVTNAAIYHTVLSWQESLNETFTQYSDYVMNSFSADELGIG